MTTMKTAYEEGWMQTYTGGKFMPMAPCIDDFRIEDIAGALSKMCRYGGHCQRFYSVAEHCVLLAEVAPDEIKLETLMHDASEAYLVDVPQPLKVQLPEYYGVESALMELIAQRYGLRWPLPARVKELDHAILSDERMQNMAPMDVPPYVWGNTRDPLGVKLKFWTPEKAEFEFLAAFHRYGGRV